jgi:glycosyltransferase involved in cell wall biosynthesis
VISFVVPAHNEARLIGGCLAGIRTAAEALALDYEIVVADDASGDATGDIARAAGASVLEVQLRHIAAVRNAGAREARGERLVFVDADSKLDAPLLEAALAALDAGAVGGGAGVRYDEPVPRWADVATRLVVRFMSAMGYAAGSFVFCRRDAFERVGGFDEAYFAGEEIALSRALKKQGRFVVLPLAIVTSPRKLEGRSPWQMLGLVARLALRGPWALRSREHLGFWYRDRR